MMPGLRVPRHEPRLPSAQYRRADRGLGPLRGAADHGRTHGLAISEQFSAFLGGAAVDFGLIFGGNSHRLDQL